MYCGCRNLYFDLNLPGSSNPERILYAVDLAVDRGEWISIVGPSGSGKSTLLTCLSGNQRATSGEIHLAGHRIDSLSSRRVAALRRLHAGFVYQNYNLVPYLTCLENVTLLSRLSGRNVSDAKGRATLQDFGLDHRAAVLAQNLSGGEQQRVAIARVVLAAPPVIFADEPTGALDRRSGALVLAALRRLVSEGSTLITVTHDLGVAARADRVAVLSDGGLVAPAAARTEHELTAMITTPGKWP